MNKKTYNKFIAKIERYYTWDKCYGSIFEDSISFFNNDENTHVFVSRFKSGEIFVIFKDTRKNVKLKKTLTTYHDINEFLNIVKLVG